MLRVEGLDVSIGAVRLLRDVSFSVAKGEVLGLVGESGSGKSLSALALMQLLPAGAKARGRALLDGEDLLTRSEPAMQALRGAHLGMVFQEPMSALNPLMPIGAQVEEVIRRHRPGADARALAAEALTRAGLPPDRFPMTRYPHDLSGGQRQRVVIAIATALRPGLIIADEPTTALDVTTQGRILDLLTGLSREDGAGLILITHDLAVAAERCDRIAVMERGRIVETAPTLDLFRAHRHPYTAALIAAAARKPLRPARPKGAPVLEARAALRTHALPRKSLLKRREVFTAVDRVSFALRAGECLALVGESGCGKSTLARAALALEPLQGGAITLRGADFAPHAALPAQRAQIQAVFQDPYGSFDPRWTVGRLVAEPFHLLSPPPPAAERRDRIARMLERVGLSAADAQKFPHEFSGGQRQRIAIARALAIHPAVAVLDEAVSALDVSVRGRVLDLLAELTEEMGVATLFISHDLHVVRAVADRVMVMERGRIVEEAETETLFRAPQHPVTRALLAATPDLERALQQREAEAASAR